MEIASFSKLLGTMVLRLLAALLPAVQPFWTPATLRQAPLPAGTFDAATLEPRGPGRYRLTLTDPSGSYPFDAVAFDLPSPDGRPATFLDLRPIERPAAATWPAKTRHLAVRVEWERWRNEAGAGAHLTFSAPRKAWLDAHDPALDLSTAALQRLLRQALADRAFDEVASASRSDP